MLGTFTLGSDSHLDNGNGRYVVAATSVVGESKVLQFAKGRKIIRTREDGTRTPARAFAGTYSYEVWNATTLQFDVYSIAFQVEADAGIASSELSTKIDQIAGALTEARILQLRNLQN